MFQTVVPFVVLIATLSIFAAVVVAAPTLTEATDEQTSNEGRGAEETVNEALNGKKAEDHSSLVDRITDIPSRAVDSTTSSSDPTSSIVVSSIVVGHSNGDVDIALGSSYSATTGNPAIVAANANDDDPVGTVDQRSACTISTGSLGDGATGHHGIRNATSVGGNALGTGSNVTVVGGNAKAACNAVGGDAVVIISSSDVSSFIYNPSGGDFWALLRTLLIQFADDIAAGRTDENVAAGGQVLCSSADALGGHGSRVVGGSAVFFAGHGGRAVGGSATVLGVVDGQLQVLCHAAGEISDVSARVASGGIVTVL